MPKTKISNTLTVHVWGSVEAGGLGVGQLPGAEAGQLEGGGRQGGGPGVPARRLHTAVMTVSRTPANTHLRRGAGLRLDCYWQGPDVGSLVHRHLVHLRRVRALQQLGLAWAHQQQVATIFFLTFTIFLL